MIRIIVRPWMKRAHYKRGRRLPQVKQKVRNYLSKLTKSWYSKDLHATLGAEAARNPLVKGEGIVCLMLRLLLLTLGAVCDIVSKFLHFVRPTGFG